MNMNHDIQSFFFISGVFNLTFPRNHAENTCGKKENRDHAAEVGVAETCDEVFILHNPKFIF